MEKAWLKNYEQGVPSAIGALQFNNLAEYIEQSCKDFANHVAFSSIGTDFTYKKFNQIATRIAYYFRDELQLKKNDRIAIMLPNIIQYPVMLLAAFKAGLIVVNVNPLYTATELTFQLKDADVKALVVLSNFAKTVEETQKDYALEHVILTDLGDMLGWLKGCAINFLLRYVKKIVPQCHVSNSIQLKTILKDSRKLTLKEKLPKVYLTDIAFLQYTGGTTGVPKAAILSHQNILSNILQSHEWIKNHAVKGKEILITPLPLYHIYSLTVNCLLFIGLGAKNILIANPRDTKRFVKILKKNPFTAITCVNTLFNALVLEPSFREVDFSHLKLTLGGGMAVQRSVAEAWQEITQKPLLEAYGLTETSPGALINPLNLVSFNGSVGLPLPSTEVKICGESGQELGFNEPGELCIKGPQVMQGYWNRPDETSHVLQEGWLKTGDVAVVNEEGFVKIVDRKKDMILVSGFNVYPNQVEEVLVTCPGVVEVGVIGESLDEAREIVVAYIVRGQTSLSELEVISYAKKHLTAYKVPKKIIFIDELPKTNVGKISRKDLKVLHQERSQS